MTGSDDAMRVGTPERERALDLLTDAASEGYLELGEHQERTERVLAARTRGDLRAVLADLEGSERVLPPAPAARDAAPVAHPGGVPPLELSIHWTTVRRGGAWEVPPRLVVTGSMGTADLDLTLATLTRPLVEIDLQVSASTVKLRLGADHTADVEGLALGGWCSVKDKAGPPTSAVGPRVVLRGSLAGWSSVVLRRG
ncbi:DUF1707 domain-containing protein [Nocardioides marinquilinus]|uniref:DUF1707 SHOCT-like domain-containing protein n=1 Tax=Nocardioides marinquilinus TaxID=1210400 RepID=UPI0031E72236